MEEKQRLRTVRLPFEVESGEKETKRWMEEKRDVRTEQAGRMF